MKTRTKKNRKERNNFELSRTKDLIQENFSNSKKNQLNYPNCQGTQTRLLSGRLTNFPMLKVFSNVYSAKTTTIKVIFLLLLFFSLFLFFSFFLFAFFFYVETIKISRSSTFFLSIYVYISVRTLTYD